MTNPCGLTGALHSGPDNTQLTPKGEVSELRKLHPTDEDTVTIEKTIGTGKDKKTEQLVKKVKDAVREFIIYSNQEKSAKEQKDDAANALREYVKVTRDKNAYAGDYQKSYRVVGGLATSGMQYGAAVQQVDRTTCPKKESDIEAIKKLVGKKFFDQYFARELIISIKKDVLDNKDLRKELTNKLIEFFGVEGIKKYFTKEEVWAIKTGLDKGQYDLADETRVKFLEAVKFYADKVDDGCFDPKNHL